MSSAGQIPERDPEDVRVEYQVAFASYSLWVGTRFTVAGFFIAAISFLAQIAFAEDTTHMTRVAIGGLALLISTCVSVMELRTRTLYASLATRLMGIERRHWHIEGEEWYSGPMSRLHKTLPDPSYQHIAVVPPHPGPDRPRIAWMKSQLPERISNAIAFSTTFDVLYPVMMLLWFGVLAHAIYNASR